MKKAYLRNKSALINLIINGEKSQVFNTNTMLDFLKSNDYEIIYLNS